MKPAAASAALTILSPAIGVVIAIAGTTVSRVKVKAVRPETLPATSVCRTSTVFDPCTSWAIVGALIDQVVPPSSEYSTLAPLSMLVSVSAGLLVMWSLLEDPGVARQCHSGGRRCGLINRQSLASLPAPGRRPHPTHRL